MKIIRSIPDLKAARRTLRGSLGFVPTMGYLHEGHLSLVRRARMENDLTMVSIFVNPIQFLPHEDFKSYPRDERRDLELLEKGGADLVFLPEVQDMYPTGHRTFIDVEGLSSVLEGVSRPGHFRGVVTVVAKLFNLTQPTKAYFGQKDAQQVSVIKKMVADLNMDVEIIVCPTIREKNGLAMSSRNAYLSPEDRLHAGILSQALSAARDLLLAGERSGDRLRRRMKEIIETVPGIKIDYVSVADSETLVELEQVTKPALASLAVKFGHVRLIDNVILD